MNKATSEDIPTLAFSSILRWVKRKLGLDRAVAFGSFSAVWSLVAGLVTLLLIASHFSQEIQGYYYTFNSLIALTVFVELGLGTVIQQFASHEWSKLSLDTRGWVKGDGNALSRLASLARVSFRWYAVAGAIAAISIAAGGIVFFSQRPSPGIVWSAPWLALCVFSGIKLLLVPAWSLLDGCNQMRNTNAARFAIGVVTTLSIWLAILLGARLWTAVTLSGTTIIAALTFLWWRYRNFFYSLRSSVTLARFSWRGEVWPMQWKIALSWLSGYLIFSLFTPVMFQFHGPIVAGQMGMTLSLANALLSFALTWVNTKAPMYGILIARQEYLALDRLFARATVQTFAVGSLGGSAIWGTVVLLNVINHPLAIRFLSPLPTALLLLATVVTVFVGSMATYLRAHKKEPYLVTSILSGVLISLSTVLLGNQYGAVGAAAGYLALNILFLVLNAMIFKRFRTMWHKNNNEPCQEACSITR